MGKALPCQNVQRHIPGFLAVAYTESLIVVDMRGPRVMFRHGKEKKRMSLLHGPNSANCIASLTWGVTPLEHGMIMLLKFL